MKVGLCAIAKNEDMYVDHWVKHYFDRGFDAITIYDNNDERDLVCKDKRVEIINVHKQLHIQHSVYKNFLNKNRSKFDWIFFCDLDEFLNCDDVKNMLNNIPKDASQVQVKWVDMSDNGYIKADFSKSPFERFTKPSKHQRKLVKSFVKTSSEKIVDAYSCHWFSKDWEHNYLTDGKLFDNNLLKNKFSNEGPYQKSDYGVNEIVLHHCDTKTIEEYIKYKFARTDAQFSGINGFTYKAIPDYGFFNFNEKTLEKLKILSKAPYNDVKDLILNSEKEYTEDLLNKYRKIYIRNLKEDAPNNRILALKSRDPIDIKDLAEFYIEDGIEKRKSLGQIKKYFS